MPVVGAGGDMSIKDVKEDFGNSRGTAGLYDCPVGVYEGKDETEVVVKGYQRLIQVY